MLSVYLSKSRYYMCIHTYTRVRSVCIYVYIYIYIYIYTCMSTYIYTYIHTHIITPLSFSLYIYIHIYIYIYTHIHIYTSHLYISPSICGWPSLYLSHLYLALSMYLPKSIEVSICPRRRHRRGARVCTPHRIVGGERVDGAARIHPPFAPRLRYDIAMGDKRACNHDVYAWFTFCSRALFSGRPPITLFV